MKLSNAFDRFQAPERVFRFSDNCGKSDSKQSNVSNSIKILSSIQRMNPKSFLTCLLESWIVTLNFSSQWIYFLERNTFTVNWQSVIVRQSDIFGATLCFLSVIPIFVIAGTSAWFRTLERAAVFLSGSAVVWKFSVLVHCKTGVANRMTVCDFSFFGISLV